MFGPRSPNCCVIAYVGVSSDEKCLETPGLDNLHHSRVPTGVDHTHVGTKPSIVRSQRLTVGVRTDRVSWRRKRISGQSRKLRQTGDAAVVRPQRVTVKRRVALHGGEDAPQVVHLRGLHASSGGRVVRFWRGGRGVGFASAVGKNCETRKRLSAKSGKGKQGHESKKKQ